MESYIVNPVYSDSHGVIDKLFPKNSFRTFIAGNSKMSKIHTRISTDSKEKQLQDDFKVLDNILDNFNNIIKEKTKLFYYKISGIYSQNKCKKTKTKVFTYCIFTILKEEGIVITSKTLSEILKLDSKKIYSGIKDVSNFLNIVGYRRETKKIPLNIVNIVNKINIPFIYNSLVEEMYEILSEIDDFKCHKPLSLLSAILFYICEENNLGIDKKKLCENIEISETTIYQINKKINVFYNKN